MKTSWKFYLTLRVRSTSAFMSRSTRLLTSFATSTVRFSPFHPCFNRYSALDVEVLHQLFQKNPIPLNWYTTSTHLASKNFIRSIVLSLVRDVNDTFKIASPMNHFGDLDFSEGSTVELTNCTGNRKFS